MSQRRFTRLTNGFSKTYLNHCAAVALYVMHYNFCRVHEALRVTPPEVVDEDWKDDLVIRLLRELKRQLIQLENTKPTTEIDQANIRIVNARALASMERTLDRLIRQDEQRALKRETKVATQNDDAYAELERRIDHLVAAADAQNSPAGPEE